MRTAKNEPAPLFGAAFDFEAFERELFAAGTSVLDAIQGAIEEAAALVERGELLEAEEPIEPQSSEKRKNAKKPNRAKN